MTRNPYKDLCITLFVVFSLGLIALIAGCDSDRVHKFTKEDGSEIIIHGRMVSKTYERMMRRYIILTDEGKYVVVENVASQKDNPCCCRWYARITTVWECKKAIGYPKDASLDQKRLWRTTFKKWYTFDKDLDITNLAKEGNVVVR